VKYQIINKPLLGEFAPYFQKYTDLVPNETVLQTLADQLNEAMLIYKGMEESKINYRYAEGKWSIKELIIHILDTERIFVYRALRIARKDQTPLPGFEQDDYINHTNWEHYLFESVVNEYEIVRKHTLLFFNHMTEEMLQQTGISSENKLSVRAIPFILAGHERHHLNKIKSRYL
jgi:hypothetical protein